MKKKLFSLLTAALVSGFAVAQSVELSTNTTAVVGTPDVSVEGTNAGTLYSNGPYYNVEGSPNISFLQDASLAMTVFGFGHANSTGNRVADDWVVTENVMVESIQFYAYQTGSTTTSTINGMTLAIWDGIPSNPSSTMIWGDQFEDVWSSSEWSGAYRQLESTPGDTSRPIMITTVLTPGLELEPGTYWLDWDAGGSLGSGPWAPPVVITGESETGNAIQFTPDTGAWVDMVDVGFQGMPFEVNGEVVTAGVGDVNATSISIYPNPTSKFLNINAKSSIESIAVYSLAGQEVMKSTPNGKNVALDVSSLSKGTYVIKTVVNGQVQTQKFVRK